MSFNLRHYFAFGSNMNVARVTERALNCGPATGARLDGFALRFNKRSRNTPVSGRANIFQETGSKVFGVLYQLEKPAEIVKMDRFEHAPVDYRRIVVEVIVDNQAIACWTYIANDRVVDNSLMPQESYLRHLLAGREFLPKEYVKKLELVVCLDN
ncbi:MAG: gamma-glutamylcyclotransferase [Gammaproteobacteria bacterium]|nr:gamma-glutamylcyclotransferase [Gammaproteobacteria bacterium]